MNAPEHPFQPQIARKPTNVYSRPQKSPDALARSYKDKHHSIDPGTVAGAPNAPFAGMATKAGTARACEVVRGMSRRRTGPFSSEPLDVL